MSSLGHALTAQQRELVGVWLPGGEIVHDHSWGLVGTSVLEVVQNGERYIIKAGAADDTHISREITVHQQWLHPWTRTRQAPELINRNVLEKILLTRYLPGRLIQGSEEEWLPDTYRQAGRLLARLHHQISVMDEDFEAASQQKALDWLDSPHRIDAATAAQLRAEIQAWEPQPVPSVPTHGDWQPRNWLVHEGRVLVIDFGRAALRPAFTDLERLEAQQFSGHPDLEVAFLDGYGPDPRSPEACRRNRLCASIGTAVWAYQVGDKAFEEQGHRMISEALTGT